MTEQLDQELFEALQIVKQHENGKTSVLKPKSNSNEDRKEFDDLVLRLFELRKQGYLEFNDKQVRPDRTRADYGYFIAMCKLNYRAEKILKYKDYDTYLEDHPSTYSSVRGLSTRDGLKTSINLHDHLRLLNEKIAALTQQKILETRAEEKLRLDHLIRECENERDEVDKLK